MDKVRNFTAAAKWFHWTVAVLMLVVLYEALGFAFRSAPDKATALPTHASVGIVVVGLTLLRSAWRAGNPPPPTPDQAPHWMHLGATIGHLLLYALIFSQGILGLWLAASSSADIRLYSGFNLSAFAPANPALYAVLQPLHAAGALALSAVLVGHVAAAFYHHFILKDDVLKRMLPFFTIALAARAETVRNLQRFPSRVPGFDWKAWGRK